MISAEIKDRLTETLVLLGVPGIGRGRFHRLIKHFGSPDAVFSASLRELRDVPGLSGTLASAIKDNGDVENARRIVARIAQLGWEVLFPGDETYPGSLAMIASPPPVLFRVGRPTQPDDRMIAIVGTRRATEAYRRITHRLAFDLAKSGVVVVSGMADGIDSAAHRGTLDAGGQTVAVWGTPLDVVYPPSNRELADRIRDRGTVYSEYPPGTELSPAFFPDRNRIISGISDGTVVVQAGTKSGALITAQYATDQGRELFAVPGPPDAPGSTGCNDLIKRGAKLVTSAEDIFDELPRLRGVVAARKFRKLPDMTKMELKMVDLLSTGPLQIDQLSRKAELPVSELLEYLLALELKGIVQEVAGKRFVLSEPQDA